MGTSDRGSVRWHRGGWEVRVQHQGRRVTRRVRAPQTRVGRREAEDVLAALVASLHVDADRLTVSGMLERYRLDGEHRWSPSTRAAHRHHSAAIAAAIGDVALPDLTRQQVREVYAAWRAEGAAAGTIRRRHSVLAAALNLAEDEGLILRAPTHRVRLGETDTESRALDLQTLPSHEVVAAGITRLEHHRLRAVAGLALATGARRGELIALRWSDVDLDGGVVHVRSAIAADGQALTRKVTKGRAARTVSVDVEAVEDLRRWCRQAADAALGLGVAMAAGMPVFSSPRDPAGLWVPDRVTTAWDRHRDAVGLSGVRFHDLRHRHATTLLEAGRPVHEVSARLGHRSVTMTLDVYAHACQARDREAAEVIGRAAGRQAT